MTLLPTLFVLGKWLALDAIRREWPLTNSVAQVAERASRSAEPALAGAGARVAQRLRRPLVVAVVGRVSAGKSTLVNAILNTAVSPTAGGECTRVVYVFRHGTWTTAVARRRDGSPPLPVAFDGSRLAGTLPLPAAEIEHVEVTLTVPLLERATVIDTPGLASTNSETSAVTQRLLADSEHAAVSADALLFCVNGPIKDDEAEAVRAFRAGPGQVRLTSGSAVAILTKADEMSEDRRSTLKDAEKLARSMSEKHADIFGGVIPVVGLLAETATTGALQESHAWALAELARAWSVDLADGVLLHRQMFLEQPGPVGSDVRDALYRLLGRYGIAELLDALRGGTRPDAGALTAVARRASRYDEMEGRLRTALGPRADMLKAGAALQVLMDCARDVGDLGVYDDAQRLLDRPEMFPLQLLDMSRVLASGRVRPPRGLAEQAWMAVTVGLPRVRRREAAGYARDWRTWSALTDVAGRSVARVMVRAWQLAAE